MTNAADYGLKADNVSFDVAKVVERSRGVAKQLNQGVGYLLKEQGRCDRRLGKAERWQRRRA